MVEHASSSTGVAGSSRDAGRDHSSQQNAGLSSIDDVVSLIRSIEGTPEQLDSAAYAGILGQLRDTLLPSLKKQYHAQKGKGQRLFTQALQGGYDPLSMLDPARNTLGYAYILTCRANHIADVEAARLLAEYVDSFARHFTPAQLLGAGEIVTALARSIANLGQILDNPIGALASLRALIDGIRATQGGYHNLTTLHPIVLYQCLRAQDYEAAYECILQFDVISADDQVSPLQASDILEYFYYGGLAFARLGRLEKACEAFELCVTCPAQQVSAIQIDAYKKLILVQLMKDGKASPLPKYTSQAVTRAIRSKLAGLELYQEIAAAYEAQQKFSMAKRDRDRVQRQGAALHNQLQSVIEKSMNLLLKDMNFGLVKRLLALYTRRRIQRISKVFSRLTIGDMVEILGGSIEGSTGDKAYAAVSVALEQMDRDRWLRVVVESRETVKDTIVRFEEYSLDFTGLEAAQRLTMVMQEARFWDQAVERKKRAVKCSEAYLNKQMSSVHRGAEWSSSINVDDFDDEAFL